MSSNVLKAQFTEVKIYAQATAGTARGDGVRDLAEAGPENFWGTSARLDWPPTWQRNRDILLQDPKVPSFETLFCCHCWFLSGTALRTNWCLSLPRWGGSTS